MISKSVGWLVLLLLLACGDTSPSSTSAVSPAGAGSAGFGGTPQGGANTGGQSGTAGSGQAGTAGEATEPVCARAEGMLAPEGEAFFGRLFLKHQGALWLLSGADTNGSGVVQGGVFQWTESGAWQRREGAFLGGDLGYQDGPVVIGKFLAGAEWAAVFDQPAFASVAIIDNEGLLASGFTGRLHRMGTDLSSWTTQFGGSGGPLGTGAATLVYPNGAKVRSFGIRPLGDMVVQDIQPTGEGETFPPPEGLEAPPPADVRWTPVEQRHVRSGRGAPLALLALEQLQATVFHDLPPLLGDAAVAVSGSIFWAFGETSAGSVLYRVDTASAQASPVEMKGLPSSAGLPWADAQAEDVLVADGERLWLMQARTGQAKLWLLELTQGVARPVTLQEGQSELTWLFQAPPEDNHFLENINGFRPADTLRGVNWKAGEVLLMRQLGVFRGMRLRLGCEP